MYSITVYLIDHDRNRSICVFELEDIDRKTMDMILWQNHNYWVLPDFYVSCYHDNAEMIDYVF